MRRAIHRQLEGLAKSLERSGEHLPLSLKLRTAELILELMARRKGFGLFVILGWKAKWRDYLDISDSHQDIFAAHHRDIMRTTVEKRLRKELTETIHFDGAILIDGRGAVVHSGAIIEGLRPKVVAKKVNPGRFADLSEQFGFNSKVHTRHLTAIAASHAFRGTTVFTVSEENRAFHVFEGGRIIHRS